MQLNLIITKLLNTNISYHETFTKSVHLLLMHVHTHYVSTVNTKDCLELLWSFVLKRFNCTVLHLVSWLRGGSKRNLCIHISYVPSTRDVQLIQSHFQSITD